MKAARLRLGAIAVTALVCVLVGAAPTGASSSGLVISQVYGGGGNAGATLKNDFIEVFNAGSTTADLTGWSVQYGSSAGTTWQVTNLTGTLAPGQYLLVQEAAGAGGTVDLPAPDASGSIAMAATAGKVALVNGTTALSGACPAGVADLVGYGTGTNCLEGLGPTASLSNTTAGLRGRNGCMDTDSNFFDFDTGVPNPRNRLSPLNFCDGDNAPTITGVTPVPGATGVATDSNVAITFSEPVDVSAGWFGINCASSGAHTVGTEVTGGPITYTLNPQNDFAGGELCSVSINGSQISDQDGNDPPDTVSRNPSWGFTTTAAVAPLIVVSQVYGGGGNAGATLKNDFIELYNRGTSAASLNGWSVQYASAAGTTWQVTNLTNFSLQPGQHYLIQEAQGAGGTVDLPTPDATGTIAMSATSGKVALVNTTTPLSGDCPTGSAIVDFVGYGSSATCFEGSGPTGTLSNTTAALRNGDGATDTNNNAADFTVGAPNPRASSDAAPAVTNRVPANGAAGVALDSDITIGFSESVNVTGSWYSISCATSGTHTASVSGGPMSFTLNPGADFVGNESCTVTVLAAAVTDQDSNDPPDNMTADDSWSFTTIAPALAIHDIQGASHTSPLTGQAVTTAGIVTAKRSNGYYIQDANADANDATSEGIFVFTSSAPTVNIGDSVRVSGNVAEFRAGGASSTNLTTTEITSPTTSIVSTGNALPGPTIIGAGGRVPPGEVIEDDAGGNVETGGLFDPANDGIDFYESLEGMRLQLNNPVVVGPRNSFGEIWVLADNGAGTAARTARGGIVIRDLGLEPPGVYTSGDFNPERMQLDDAAGVATPNANVGDHFDAPAIGVLDYDFGNFELEVTSALTTVSDGVTRETTADAGANELTVATFNVENLDAAEPQSKFDALAAEIVTNMKAPDVVSLEEIQDNNGATNDSVVDADQTLGKLVAAIQAAGGPTYDWRQINPVDDQDGGEPGGNIRVGFIFRTDRGLAFVDRPGGGSTTPTTVVNGPDGPELSASPGRVDPTNAAWNASRKPLAGEFTYRGQTFFLITNHFNSKTGDQPLFGRFQPPTRSSEVQRHQQAQIVNNFVDSILALDANANVIVLGDINDFEFSQTMSILEGDALHALMRTLPQNERYSYVFDGNSQSLDHIVVSNSLFSNPFAYDPVHVNAEFFDQLSDHDPQVARFLVESAPTVSANGPYTVAEGSSVTLSATGSDPNGDPLTYAWDLDNNGTFETAGQSVTFSAAGINGPATRTVKVRASDGSSSATDEATVTITNAAPTVAAGGPYPVAEGSSTTVSATGSDPGGDALTYEWDLDNNGTFETAGQSVTFSAATIDGPATLTVVVRASDGTDSATAQATVMVTNVAPTATFNAPATALAGFPFTLSLTSSSDPAPADTFTYAFDCGDPAAPGYGLFGSASTGTCPTTAVGSRTVHGTIRDDDGDSTEYTATVRVVVTFDSLCNVVRRVVTSVDVANALCDKLNAAEAAHERGNASAKENQLEAFRSQVDAQTGKSITLADATMLKELSRGL